MPKKIYSGINIQFPISQEIISGKKTVETRTYPIPEKYLNQEMLLIETPGKTGTFKARIIAIIKFIECFQYKTKKEFYSQQERHLITKNSKWDWKDKEKWGWKIQIIDIVSPAISFQKQKGIIFTKNLTL